MRKAVVRLNRRMLLFNHSKYPKDCTPITLYDVIEGRMQEVQS